MRNIYINSQGGLGFNLALSHIAKELKENYNKVCVLSPYYDVFEVCPYVDYVYRPNEIRDFIFDAKHDDAKLICERMYDTEDFIYKKLSYADAWRKASGIKIKNNKEGSDTKAELTPLKKYPFLKNEVENTLNQIRSLGYKDFVIMQFEGGQSPLVEIPKNADGTLDWSQVPTNYDFEPLKRHYPFELAQEFIDLFRKTYPNTAIVMYQLPNEHQYNNTVCPTMPYLGYYELACDEKCRGTVSIDSSLQHLVAGITKSVVIWGHSLPQSFGYQYNKNVIQECNRDSILYFSALGPSGAKIDYIEPNELLKIVGEYIMGDSETKE